MNEPRITINGIELRVGAAMTVRCAIECFASTLQSEGCGDDEHGKLMTQGYLARIAEIRELIFANTSTESK